MTVISPSEIHGFTGPWIIEDSTASPGVVERFLNAGAELGYDILEPNDPSHTGKLTLPCNCAYESKSSSNSFRNPQGCLDSNKFQIHEEDVESQMINCQDC